MSPKLSALLVALIALAFAASPFWFSGFGGFDPNRFPVPQVEPPVQPAGYAFAIWGLIYLWLIAHALFGLLRRAEDTKWNATRRPLFLSLGIGASWIGVAQANPILATVLIWAMLGMAVMALMAAKDGPDRWLLRTPLALYAGWLTAASCVAVGVNAAGYGLGPSDIVWAWAMLALALGVGIVVQSQLQGTPEYSLTIIWALVAIAVQNATLGNTGLIVGSVVGILLLLILIFRQMRA